MRTARHRDRCPPPRPIRCSRNSPARSPQIAISSGHDGVANAIVAGENVELLAERALHWPRASTLFVADVHLGKAAAFRAGGVAIPRGATANDLARLTALVARTRRAHLVVLGDFLHAAADASPRSTPRSSRWRDAHATLAITLVRGNHDAQRRRSAGRVGRRRRRRPASARAVPAVPRAGVAADRATRCAGTCTRACASRPARTSRCGCRASCSGGGARCCRRSGGSPASRSSHPRAGETRRRHRRTAALRAAPALAPAVALRPATRQSALSQNCNARRNRSSAGLPVDKPVNMRWNVLGYAANGACRGLFLLSFFDPSLVHQKALAKRRPPYYAWCSSGTSTQDVVDFDLQEETGLPSLAVTPTRRRRPEGKSERAVPKPASRLALHESAGTGRKRR